MSLGVLYDLADNGGQKREENHSLWGGGSYGQSSKTLETIRPGGKGGRKITRDKIKTG